MVYDADERASIAACIRKGDAAAEEGLATLYRERVFLMALMRTKDREAAADLANDTVMAVLLALRNGQLRQPDNVAAFVHGTARNLINNHFRRQCQRREDPITEEVAYTQQDTLVDDERRRMVREALRELDAKDRGILLLTMVEGLKPGAIAERLQLTSDVVRARKSRALKKVVESVRKMVTKIRPHATSQRGSS